MAGEQLEELEVVYQLPVVRARVVLCDDREEVDDHRARRLQQLVPGSENNHEDDGEPPPHHHHLPPPEPSLIAKVQRPEALTKHRVVERGALSTQKKEIEEEGWDPQHVDDDGDDGDEDELIVLLAIALDRGHDVEVLQLEQIVHLAACKEREGRLDEHRVHQGQYRNVRTDGAVDCSGEARRALKPQQGLDRWGEPPYPRDPE
mmetsp:Transcript_69969/g.155916  ORF Transcript_69969/g.155916 Transcript_69969/m.155916 type:complete len:204 (-) Transcript_69969:211-822(-)